MDVREFIKILGAEFYAGVPDSQLKSLCNYLMAEYGVDNKHHFIAANEGNATALAAGYHLATGKVPVVYMQNSGEGNVINPVASLMNREVYGIPCIFVVGWRGEPGVHDEPQHIYQGKVTLKLLDDMEINSFVLSQDTTADELEGVMDEFRTELSSGRQVAFVVRKNALTFDKKVKYSNDNMMRREEIIEHITKVSGNDIIVSTTGKASRELFEIRERRGEGHENDFLTVGSMGHSSSIALSIAKWKENEKVWIIDGDGALLMHMGSMAVMGSAAPSNIVHIVINNASHETVGGQPTAAGNIDIAAIALSCGYKSSVCVCSPEELDKELIKAKSSDMLSLIEVKCAIGAREDLGRPTVAAKDNKEAFMKRLN